MSNNSELGRAIEIGIPVVNLQIGSARAIAAQLASERMGLGITAKVLKPKGGNGSGNNHRSVVVSFSGNGEQKFSKLVGHPRIRVAELLETIDSLERAKFAKDVSGKEAARIGHEIEAHKSRITALSGVHDIKHLPKLGSDSLRSFFGPAIDAIS